MFAFRQRMALEITCVTLFAVLAGCGDAPVSPPPTRDTGAIIRECVESSGQKLDVAMASGDVASAASEIVSRLDDYEDYEELEPFKKFHRQMEELESLAGSGASADELKQKIDDVKQLAEAALSQNAD